MIKTAVLGLVFSGPSYILWTRSSFGCFLQLNDIIEQMFMETKTEGQSTLIIIEG